MAVVSLCGVCAVKKGGFVLKLFEKKETYEAPKAEVVSFENDYVLAS